MKIQNDPPDPSALAINRTAIRPVIKEPGNSQSAEPDQPSTDSAALSQIAERIDADPARIEQLRQAVQNGTYSVPANAVAARLVDAHLDDLNKRS